MTTTIEAMWARAEPLLRAALVHARGTHEPADILQGWVDGKLQLWVGEDSVAVSEVLPYPRMRVLNVFLGAGRMAELLDCLPGMEAFARGSGCSRIMFSGRLDDHDGRKSGWERFFPEWEPTHIALIKDLP